MAVFKEIGDGVRTTYRIPLQTGTATATVDGTPATISTQGPSFVTFDTAPGDGEVVAITYTPVRVVDKVPASAVQVEGFTTAGGTDVSAGSAQEVIEAVADLADPL